MARIAGKASVAIEPNRFGIAPVAAAEQALAKTGVSWSDIGAVELNEAFAVQSLACIDVWGIDPDIVNVNGGAIAIGHPSAPQALDSSARWPRPCARAATAGVSRRSASA